MGCFKDDTVLPLSYSDESTSIMDGFVNFNYPLLAGPILIFQYLKPYKPLLLSQMSFGKSFLGGRTLSAKANTLPVKSHPCDLCKNSSPAGNINVW